jgi:hypothetical protein
LVAFIILGGVLGWYFAAPTILSEFAGAFRGMGLIADVLALGVLLVSISIDRYPKETYVSSYFDKARLIEAYTRLSKEDLVTILSNFHGDLKATTQNVLASDVGAALIAISTLLTLIGDLTR